MMNNEQGILLYTISKPLIKSKSGVYQILKQFEIHVILFFLLKVVVCLLLLLIGNRDKNVLGIKM